MRRIAQRKQFRADLKRQKRRGKDIEELIAVFELLAERGALPSAYRPHKLSANGAASESATSSRIGS
jgi:mRNA-degrading endonuclease YafQ of YafQ-DinJ toxin-antitoxin module